MRWPLKIIKIAGHSMEPTIRNGELKLINQWIYLLRKPRADEIVIFASPQTSDKLFCKRVARVDRQKNEYELLGDNPADSLDSRRLGPVKKSQIIGKVVC